jgi:PAS domain S-box-containing protein
MRRLALLDEITGEDADSAKRSRGPIGRCLGVLRRHVWMAALVPTILGTLALTAGLIRSEANRADKLRRAEISAAVAPDMVQAIELTPERVLEGQPLDAGDFDFAALLRRRLTSEMTQLVRLWPTSASRQAAAEARTLNAQTVTLMGLVQTGRLYQATALYNDQTVPLSNRLLADLRTIGRTLGQQSTRAGDGASTDALLIVAAAAAGLLLLVTLLVIADRRRVLHAGERRELEHNQERWRTLFAHLQEILILVDGEGTITYTSPSVERWLGYGAAELEGCPLASIEHPDDAEQVAKSLEPAGPHQFASVTHRVRAKDASWHTLESSVVCLRDDPAVAAILVAARDVTEHVALEQERERLELDRRVSQRLEAVGQLSAGIAHEINTPLQFVGDSISFLKDAVEEVLILTGLYRESLYLDTPIPVAERRQTMREAEEAADIEYLCERIPVAFDRTVDGISRVRSIVQAMKRFSHASSTDIAPADINDAVETTLAVCRNEYKYVAEMSLDLGEIPAVECNISEINQVFLNLIINAAQAIGEKVGSSGQIGEIKISTRVDGGDAVIEIADDGPGIPPELQDRIYEPFFTTKEVGKGTGQGLALARTTIERHSGSLKCSTAVGAGTTFTIRLPIVREPSAAPVSSAGPAETESLAA